MRIRRTLDTVLEAWAQKGIRKPLLLHGIPRVGKSSLVATLADCLFKDSVLRIDCAQEEQARPILLNQANLGGILGALRRAMGVKLVAGKHLLVIENLHLMPGSLAAIEEVARQEPSLHVILTAIWHGALPEQFRVAAKSFTCSEVLPLSFTEFLAARKQTDLAAALSIAPRPISERLHFRMLHEMGSYLIVGGMPECVAAFCATQRLEESHAVQKRCIEALLNLSGEKDLQRRTLESAMRFVALKSSTKIDQSDFADELPATLVKPTLDLMESIGLTRKVTPYSSGGAESLQRRVRGFKLLLVDSGLMCALSYPAAPPQAPRAVVDFVGSSRLCEQFIGQEIIHCNSNPLEFWAGSAKGSISKVDYFVKIKEKRYPTVVEQANMQPVFDSIEVCLGSYPACPNAFVFSPRTYEVPNPKARIVEIPYYFASAIAGTPASEAREG